MLGKGFENRQTIHFSWGWSQWVDKKNCSVNIIFFKWLGKRGGGGLTKWIRFLTDPVKLGLFYKHLCNLLIH